MPGSVSHRAASLRRVPGLASPDRHRRCSGDDFVDTTNPPDGPHTYRWLQSTVAGNSSAQSPAFGVVVDSNAQTAPTSLSDARPVDEPAPADLVGRPGQPRGVRAPLRDLPERHFVDRHVLAARDDITDNTGLAPDNSYAYVVVADRRPPLFTGTPSGAVGVVYDTVAPSGPAGVWPAPRSTAR